VWLLIILPRVFECSSWLDSASGECEGVCRCRRSSGRQRTHVSSCSSLVWPVDTYSSLLTAALSHSVCCCCCCYCCEVYSLNLSEDLYACVLTSFCIFLESQRMLEKKLLSKVKNLFYIYIYFLVF